jgi:hypothetical protein
LKNGVLAGLFVGDGKFVSRCHKLPVIKRPRGIF